MGKTILLTGGSACGKSTFAEKLLSAAPAPRYYVATMRPFGDGAARKIERHREMRREKGFLSIEKYTDVGAIEISDGASVLLECLCNLTANEMFADDGEMRDATAKILADLALLASKCATLIVVTNDVGGDTGQYAASSLEYVETLGRLNAVLARQFDEAYELVVGIPLALKGEKI